MPLVRKNVFELGGDWAGPILWYARGVAAMKTRPLADRTSWRFYGAIHGMDRGLWEQFGYLAASDVNPPQGDIDRFWDQCQHGTWYFLPWHRGYLLAFESTLRAAVVGLGGPSDWTLPYWNYLEPNQINLPPAFSTPDWPDGHGNNPLFVQQRYGPLGDGVVVVPANSLDLSAMTDPDFTGPAEGGSTGFGGVDTGFSHPGVATGGVELSPHAVVHALVGGRDRQPPHFKGMMSMPATAALDPIFWLHHANIDRLWEVWRENPASDVDPTDPKWIRGPASIGDRGFSMPIPDGTPKDFTPGDVSDLAGLGYTYDDLSPAVPVIQAAARLFRLGAGEAFVRSMEGVGVMPSRRNVELVGVNRGPLRITGAQAVTSIHLDHEMRRRVTESLTQFALDSYPDRVFLNLENVKGTDDSAVLQVYVEAPASGKFDRSAARLAGTVALFGLRQASLVNGEHAGQGMTFVLEITNIVDSLYLENSLDVDSLQVRIAPIMPVPQNEQITIGRISIYRQGTDRA